MLKWSKTFVTWAATYREQETVTRNAWKGGKCIRETSKHLEKQEYQPRRENQAL